MNRREFHKSTLGAVTSAATFPLGAVATPAPAAVPGGIYPFAVAMAKARGVVSDNLLRRALHVDAEVAHALMGRLVERGVVHAPGAGGLARAVKPMFQHGIALGNLGSFARAPGNPWHVVAAQIRRATTQYQLVYTTRSG